MKPVAVLMLPLGLNWIVSVLSTPAAAAEFTDPAVTTWHAPAAIAPVLIVRAPLAIEAAVVRTTPASSLVLRILLVESTYTEVVPSGGVAGAVTLTKVR